MTSTKRHAPQLEFGPVELNAILFSGDGPSSGLLHSLADQVNAGTVRLLDFVIVVKSQAGALEVREIDSAEFELAGLELHAPGLAGDEDLIELAQVLPEGGSAAIVAFELLWAKDLAEQLFAEGSVVLATERIPAPVVNAVVEMAFNG